MTVWLTGQQQDALAAALKEAAAETMKQVDDRLDPLYEHRSDVQSPAGASMVGILDEENHFSGTTVEEALQELARELWILKQKLNG